MTGNPVRAAVVAVRDSAYPAPTGAINILITGGSQAASIFSNIVPDAMAALPDSLKKSLAVVHQAREADVAATAEKYKKAGISAEIKPFFSDMPERLRACHLFNRQVRRVDRGRNRGRGQAGAVRAVPAQGPAADVQRRVRLRPRRRVDFAAGKF